MIKQLVSNLDIFVQKSKVFNGPLRPLHAKVHTPSPYASCCYHVNMLLSASCCYHVIHSSHTLVQPLSGTRDFEQDWCTHKEVACPPFSCEQGARNKFSPKYRSSSCILYNKLSLGPQRARLGGA